MTEPVAPNRVFPFFVGCARSGTTLLRAIFNAHPNLAIPDEAHYFADMVLKRDTYKDDGAFSIDRFLADLFDHKWFPRLGIPEDTIRRAGATQSPSSYAEAVRLVFSLYAEQQGKSRYADKTPRNVLNLQALAEAFPDARIVHIIRDGRDVALSLLDMPWGPRSIGEAARYWERRVGRGRDAGNEIGPLRYRTAIYEDLLADPEGAVRSLCRFIELPFEPIMMRYFERADDVVAPNPVTRGRVLLPPTVGLRDWRTQMSRSDVLVFEFVAGTLLQELGYQRAMPRLTLPESLRAQAGLTATDGRTKIDRFVKRTRRVAARMKSS